MNTLYSYTLHFLFIKILMIYCQKSQLIAHKSLLFQHFLKIHKNFQALNFLPSLLYAGQGMEDDFSIIYTSNFLPFNFHSIPKIFHFILKFSSIFHSIKKTFRLEAIQCIFCTFAMLQATTHENARNNTKMQ